MSANGDHSGVQQRWFRKAGRTASSRRRPSVSFAVAVLTAAAAFVGPAGGAQTETGKLAFATSGDGVSNLLEIGVVSPNGGPIKKLTHHRLSGDSPTWTTTGRHFVFEVSDSFTGRGSHWRVAWDGRRLKRLSGAGEWDVPSPDGRHVARIGGRADIEIINDRGKIVRRLFFGRSVNWRLDYLDAPPLWSRDGRWLAIDAGTDVGDYSRTIVLPVNGRMGARALGRRLDGRHEAANAWSPTGRYLALSTPRGLDVVRADGSGRRRVAGKDAAWNRVSWAPDERRLVYAGRNGGIYVVGKGRPRRIVRTVSRGPSARHDLSVAWSPTGRQIAYTDRSGLFVVRPDGSGRRRIAGGKASAPSWDPQGRRLVYGRDGAIVVVAVGGHARQPRLVLPESIWDDSPRWSLDGTRIAFVRGPEGMDSPREISTYIMRADGTGQTRIGRGHGPRWSPDGRHLAFVDAVGAAPPRMGKLATSRIMVGDVFRRDAKLVARGTDPAWSPDGRKLAFMRYEFGKEASGPARGSYYVRYSRLFTADADGSDTQLLASSAASGSGGIHHYSPAWSPDGSTIAVVSIGEDPHHDVTLVDVASRSTRTLPIEAYEIAWSPDGTWLAYATLEEIGIVRRDGTARRVLAGTSSGPVRGDFSDPCWSPDGRRIAFINSDDGDEETGRPASQDVYVLNVDGSGFKRLTRTRGIEGALDWSSR